jgi:phosphoglycerate dehydrogenase-like enzyme
MPERAADPIVVCLGYPQLLGPEQVAQVEAIDPRIEAVVLPVDPGAEWIRVPPAEPHPEPPPWATGVAALRHAALARCQVLLALHAPADLPLLAPKLRWIHGVGAGVEQFAAAGVSEDRCVVTNSSGLSAGSMAEFVIGRLLAFWKRFPEQLELQRRHQYVQTYGRSFAGSTIGIVGLGHIGIEVARRSRALGCRVLGLRRSHVPGAASDHAEGLFGPDGLHAMLGECDAVVVAAPATDATRHLIDAAALAAMRRGAVLVNVARGSLVDEAALIESLRAGQLGGAALDVFEEEPLPAASELWELPNVLLSAHSSVSTDRYAADVFDLFLENLRRYVQGEPLRNRVDMRALGFRATG